MPPSELWTQPGGGGPLTNRVANWGVDDLLFYPDSGGTALAFVEAGAPAKPAPIWKGPPARNGNVNDVSASAATATRIAIVGQSANRRGRHGTAKVLTRNGRTVEQAQQFPNSNSPGSLRQQVASSA